MSFGNYRYKIVTLLFGLSLNFCFAPGVKVIYAQGVRTQITENECQRIKTLFENDMFDSVMSEISLLKGRWNTFSQDVQMELDYYYALSSLKLNHPNVAGVVYEYEKKYPYSSQISLLNFYLSKYYFEKGEYATSQEVINDINAKYLSKEQRWEFLFNKAYCRMRVGDNEVAKVGFKQLINLGNTPYSASASYYLAYLEYLSNNFNESVKIFKTLENNHDHSLLSKYFISESYFMMKEYSDAIKYGEGIYDSLKGDFQLKCARILSQSYYELGDKRKAKEYLDKYSNHNDKLSRKDNYYMGVVSYSLQSYYAAVNAFSKVITERDSLAQNGYLYLGNSYLAIKNKLGAYNAFKEAAFMEFDPTIKREAYFLYAKLAFDLNSDITPFKNYLSLYPSSKRGDEIYNYIATSYLLSKNFEDAISALKMVKYLTPEMTLNLQKAAFFRGLQCIDMDSYKSAIEYLTLSVKNGVHNPSLTMLAKFWISESYYRINEYQKTIESVEPLVTNSSFIGSGEYPLALVNLGYAYFHQSNYPKAQKWFEEYLSLTPSRRNMTLEVRTRLADCYYMSGDYERAAEIYEDVALKTFSTDDVYASYMGALSFGLSSMPEKKITMLRDIVDNKYTNDYYHIALYELGRTYVQQEDNESAVKCFNTLLKDGRDSTYHTKSLLELGMISSNLLKYNDALNYFDSIVQNYPLSTDVSNALMGIESVYSLQNNPEGYLAYLEKVGMSSIKSEDEKELMLFNSAEQLFLGGKYDKAIESLNSFISKYPEGIKLPQAYFYLGESYSKMAKPEFAADAYLKVMNTGEGAFVELATLYYAKIELALEHFEKGAIAFESLLEIAQFENNKLEALVGKMRCYYGAKDYSKTIMSANDILSSDIKEQSILFETNYKLAKSYHALGERDKALPIFQNLAADYSTTEGAECAYMLVLQAYDEGDFEKVESMVYSFADSGNFQTYWLAKCFITLGDSFAERDEWEQAKATFESIKEGYTPTKEHDDVLEQVQMRLKKIQEQE